MAWREGVFMSHGIEMGRRALTRAALSRPECSAVTHVFLTPSQVDARVGLQESTHHLHMAIMRCDEKRVEPVVRRLVDVCVALQQQHTDQFEVTGACCPHERRTLGDAGSAPQQRAHHLDVPRSRRH